MAEGRREGGGKEFQFSFFGCRKGRGQTTGRSPLSRDREGATGSREGKRETGQSSSFLLFQSSGDSDSLVYVLHKTLSTFYTSCITERREKHS